MAASVLLTVSISVTAALRSSVTNEVTGLPPSPALDWRAPPALSSFAAAFRGPVFGNRSVRIWYSTSIYVIAAEVKHNCPD
jgi:hypothetical protein